MTRRYVIYHSENDKFASIGGSGNRLSWRPTSKDIQYYFTQDDVDLITGIWQELDKWLSFDKYMAANWKNLGPRKPLPPQVHKTLSSLVRNYERNWQEFFHIIPVVLTEENELVPQYTEARGMPIFDIRSMMKQAERRANSTPHTHRKLTYK